MTKDVGGALRCFGIVEGIWLIGSEGACRTSGLAFS